ESKSHVFSMLVDAPIDPLERYLGFPYYLEIKYSCEGLTSKAQVRRGHLTGLKPVVLVTFQPPVNFYRWKIERLQIQMEAAPFLNSDPCVAEVCVMSWYTPMPIKNGSVVMYVDVSSNGLGPFITDKRFQMNINGFLKRKREDNEIHFIVGDTLSDLMPQDFVNITSSPLWYTINQSPVLILGGIPNEKYILLTDTSFNDFSLVELSIDSCWVGSFYCPQTGFTATIYDTIATESTLFIRQNQLVYYFTGTYSTLHEHDRGSGRWIRVLANECIKKLCPVPFHSNGSEYILALTTGKNEGYVHFGTITATDNLEILYNLPEFIPDARGLEFLMILGVESFTSTPMIPKGLSYNPYSSLLFIWGNFLLLSYDSEDFIYLADFPKEQFIKYLVSSFRGDMVIVTENEEIWYYQESSYRVYQLFPSKGWEVHLSLQLMHQSSEYASNTTMLTLFYEDSELYQLVYLQDGSEGRLTKRLLPVEKILSYQQLENHYQLKQQGNYSALTFTNLCPFTVLRLRDLPKPQRFTRQERYRARAPYVLDLSGFHSEDSLAVYQGLVYYLLWLHSKYDKPYADPVHDPTWRWWKNKKQDKDYYFYLASNRRSVGGVHIDMDSYEKIYDLKSESKLPKHIFLDKGTVYSFSILLSSREHNFKAKPTFGTAFQVESQLELGVVLAHPRCIDVEVLQKVFINRNSVLFSIKIKDKMLCYDQGLSGHHLMKTSMTLKVVGTSGNCFKSTNVGDSMQGNLMMPMYIGCPPGKRLAFDITYTLEYSRMRNKHYFDCVHKDPEMPCFLFRDMFYPFFLIQDLVTGDSGSFTGSYVLKVVGGGPTLSGLRDYSEEEIYRYNSPLNKTNSLIWTTTTSRTTKDLAFHILSYESQGIDIFAPEFFFKVLVSNRDVDESTYCDYQLTFLLHIHGLPLSAKRALFILTVSSSIFLGLVLLYIIICLLWPYMIKVCSILRWKINNMITSESYYSYATSKVFTTPPGSVGTFKEGHL
ncbi:Cation channel sperm-associated protein subunit gamma, partial [Tupaia chinensis]